MSTVAALAEKFRQLRVNTAQVGLQLGITFTTDELEILENVFEAFGCHERSASALALEKRV